jgi:hypothetical protein
MPGRRHRLRLDLQVRREVARCGRQRSGYRNSISIISSSDGSGVSCPIFRATS